MCVCVWSACWHVGVSCVIPVLVTAASHAAVCTSGPPDVFQRWCGLCVCAGTASPTYSVMKPACCVSRARADRDALGSEVTQLKARVARQAADVAALNDLLRSTSYQASQDREERARACSERDAATAQRDAAVSECNRLCMDRDALVGELAASVDAVTELQAAKDSASKQLTRAATEVRHAVRHAAALAADLSEVYLRAYFSGQAATAATTAQNCDDYCELRRSQFDRELCLAAVIAYPRDRQAQLMECLRRV